jgi:hypothetical protein
VKISAPVTLVSDFCEEFDMSPSNFYLFLSEIGWPLVGRGNRYEFTLRDTLWIAEQLPLWKEYDMYNLGLVKVGAEFDTRDLPNTPIVGSARITDIEWDGSNRQMVTFVYSRPGFMESTRTLHVDDIVFFLDRGAWHLHTGKPEFHRSVLSVAAVEDMEEAMVDVLDEAERLVADHDPDSVRRVLHDWLDEMWEKRSWR